ncbi:YqaJ viral recombinase family protein [Peptostreptococcus porci]|uniref:YqaJ viral recombinase family protein n=1 Tax=Peptostreptococcus porci TaxID=2652282 RepID=UPI002A817353|nr:YqaJ viral recombinase family protein [Peptostreptococcus porci]
MELFKSRDDWLKGRKRVGGSEAAAILGRNPYMDNQRLWEIKTGRVESEDISSKPYVLYGTHAEAPLRELFALDFPEYEVGYKENNMFTNSKYPFAHASLDGWIKDTDGRMGVLEIKTTEILKSMQKEKWNERVPDNYYIQLIHNMLVTEFEFAILKAQLKYSYNNDVFLHTRHYIIERQDILDDLELLARQEKEFWEYVEKDERPPLVLPVI